MTSVDHDRPSWLDFDLTDFAGRPVHAVTDRTDYRPPSLTCETCGTLENNTGIPNGNGLRMTARNHAAETGHAVTLSSGERVTVFEVPPAGVADPLGTLDMFGELS
jgi:hypothetical protein